MGSTYIFLISLNLLVSILRLINFSFRLLASIVWLITISFFICINSRSLYVMLRNTQCPIKRPGIHRHNGADDAKFKYIQGGPVVR